MANCLHAKLSSSSAAGRAFQTTLSTPGEGAVGVAQDDGAADVHLWERRFIQRQSGNTGGSWSSFDIFDIRYVWALTDSIVLHKMTFQQKHHLKCFYIYALWV